MEAFPAKDHGTVERSPELKISDGNKRFDIGCICVSEFEEYHRQHSRRRQILRIILSCRIDSCDQRLKLSKFRDGLANASPVKCSLHFDDCADILGRNDPRPSAFRLVLVHFDPKRRSLDLVIDDHIKMGALMRGRKALRSYKTRDDSVPLRQKRCEPVTNRCFADDPVMRGDNLLFCVRQSQIVVCQHGPLCDQKLLPRRRVPSIDFLGHPASSFSY
jgi:hypothetical protein